MRPDSHEIYGRRRSRNLGLGLTLARLRDPHLRGDGGEAARGGRHARLRPHRREPAARDERGLSDGAARGRTAGSGSRSSRSCRSWSRASFAAVPVLQLVLQGDRLRRHHRASPTAGARRRSSTGWSRSRFDANTAPDMPWEFRPKQRSMKLQARRDRARLLRGLQPDRPGASAGQAGFNVVPFSVGELLRQDRLLLLQHAGAAAARARRDAGHLLRRSRRCSTTARRADVTDITLSYTMYPADLPERRRRGGGRATTQARGGAGRPRRQDRTIEGPTMAGHKNHDYHILPPSIWPLHRRGRRRSPCSAARCSGSTTAAPGSR